MTDKSVILCYDNEAKPKITDCCSPLRLALSIQHQCVGESCRSYK